MKITAKIAALAAAFLMSGCSGQGSDQAATSSPAAQLAEPAGAASQERVRLLSREQYFNTLAALLGEDLRLPGRFAPFNRTEGLESLGASAARVTVSGVQLYQQTAGAVANRIVDPAHRDYLLPCHPASEKTSDRACAQAFLKRIAPLLYRRPISDARLTELVDRASVSADKLGDFYAGLSLVLEGMLISPEVLFVADRSEPDPARPGLRRLDSYSLATRLSLFLWNALPDEELLRAAQAGELQTASGRARNVDRMLKSPRLKSGMRAFFTDMLKFEDLDNLAKDAAVYPAFTDVVARDAREQTLLTITDHLITKNADYRDLFTTRSTFVSPALATIYGVPASTSWRPYTFAPDSPRVGVLTQISFLASHAHPARSSATRRGQALRELFLCQTVPPPPPNVDFSAVENPEANLKTARARVTVHLQNPICAGCHRITDPIGLSMENFDGAGQYRMEENGVALDVNGSLDGTTFSDVAGLAQAVHDHKALSSCLVRRVYTYAVGTPTSRANRETVEAILKALNENFIAQGYRVPALLRAIALSKAFSSVEADAAAAKVAALQ